MKKKIRNLEAFIRKCGVFALCFVMLFVAAGALAEPRAEENERSKDISKFGTMTYDPELPENGAFFEEGDVIRFSITAKETPDKLLFDRNDMYYNLFPSTGLDYEIDINPTNGKYILAFQIKDNTDNERLKLLRAEVAMDEDGDLTLVWDTTSPAYEVFTTISNTQFSLGVHGTVDGSSDVIEFDADHRYYVNNTSEAKFTKTFGDDAAAARIKAMWDKLNSTDPEDAEIIDALKAMTFKTRLTLAKPQNQCDPATEFVDKNGHVRNITTGKIVYLSEQEYTVDMTQLSYDEDKKHFYYAWQNVQPNNTGFTVTESGENIILDDYGFSFVEEVEGQKVSNKTASVNAIAPFASNSCSLINTYAQDTFTLKVNKDFYTNPVTVPNALLPENVNNAQANAIRITVSGKTKNGVEVNETFTYASMTAYENDSLHNGRYREITLPAGSYTVTEEAELDNFKWIVAMYKIGDQNSKSFETDESMNPGGEADGQLIYTGAHTTPGFDVEGNSVVTLNNGYTTDVGSLTLTKGFGEDCPLEDGQKDDVTFYMTTQVDGHTKYVWFNFENRGEFKYLGLTNSMDSKPTGETGQTYCEIANTSSFLPNGAVNFVNLPLGTYKIHETKADFNGYQRTTKYSINSSSLNELSGDGFDVNVTLGNTPVTITNEYKETGRLTVTKNFVGGGLIPEAERAKTQFQLQKKVGDQFENVGEPVAYGDFTNQAYTWNNLPYGVYKVVESGAPTSEHYTLATTFVVKEYDGKTLADKASAAGTGAEVNVSNPWQDEGAVSGTVQQPSAAEAKFTNTYEPIKAALVITKAFGNNGYPLSADMTTLQGQMKFVVKRGSTTLYWLPVEGKTGEYMAVGAGTANAVTEIPYSASIRLTGLASGQSYTVTEMHGDLNGYNRKTTVNNIQTNAENPSGTTEALDPDEDKTIAFLNTYDPYATLKITKNFISNDLSSDYCDEVIKPELKFVIHTLEDNKQMYYTGSGFSENKEGAKVYSYSTLSGESGVVLPGNKTYYVTEQNADLGSTLDEYYTITTWSVIDEKDDTHNDGATSNGVQLTPGAVKTVNFSNQYVEKHSNGIVPGPNIGLLINQKNWIGLDSDGLCNDEEGQKVKGEVRFKIYRKAADNSWKLYDTYTLGELLGGNGGKYRNQTVGVILPTGEYMFEEVADTAGVDGYSRKTLLSIKNFTADNFPTPEDITTAGKTFTVSGNDVLQFSLSNIYTPLGDLTVTKTIDQNGDLTSLNTDQKKLIGFTVSVAEPGSNTYTVIDDGSFTLNDMGDTLSKTFTNLPVGRYAETDEGTVFRYFRYKVQETNGLGEYACEATVTLANGPSVADVTGTDDAVATGIAVLNKKNVSSISTVNFSNKFLRKKGNLEIVKVLHGIEYGELDDELKAKLNGSTFTVWQGSNQVKWSLVKGEYHYDPNGDISQFTYAQMSGGKYIIRSLPTGNYSVRETNADLPNFNRTTTFSVAGSSAEANGASSASDTSPEVGVSAQENTTVTVTNAYTGSGAVKVRKTLAFVGKSILDDSKRQNITFELWNAANVKVGSVQLKDMTVNIAGEYEYTFTNLDVGDYTIKESSADFENYSRTTKIWVDNVEKSGESNISASGVSVSQGVATDVKIQNTYEERGELRIEKSWSGIEKTYIESKLKDKQDILVYVIRDAAGNILSDDEGRYVEDQNGNKIGTVTYAQIPFVKRNLPAGQYTVEEIIYNPSNPSDDASNPFHGYVHTGSGYTISTYTDNEYKQGQKQVESGSLNRDPDSNTYSIKSEEEGFRVGSLYTKATFTNTYKQIGALTVTKTSNSYQMMEVSDDQLPVWKFEVKIKNISKDNTRNGYTTLTDTFDIVNANKFKLYLEEGYTPVISVNGASAAVTYREGTGKAEFDIPCMLNGNAISSDITLTYYLQPVSKQALNELTAAQINSAKTKNEYGVAEWKFTNTVQYYKMPLPEKVTEAEKPNYIGTVTADYFYQVPALKKSMDDIEEGDTRVTFVLDINPEGRRIGTGDNLIVYDDLSPSLQIDEASFIITPSELTPWVSYNAYTGTDGAYDLEISVPNEKHVTIEYAARVIQTGQDVLVKNTATMIGVTETVDDHHDFAGVGSGSGSNAQIILYKHGTQRTERLAGAKFGLYEAADPENLLGEYITGADGTVRVHTYTDASNTQISLKFGVQYFVRELASPKGYLISSNEHPFILVEKDEDITDIMTNPKKPGDVLYFANEPLSTSVTLQAQKAVTGNQLSEGQFTFDLYDDANNLKQSKQNDADGKVVFDSIPYTYTHLYTGNDENGMPQYADSKDFVYTIREDKSEPLPGYTYSDQDIKVTVTLELVRNADGTYSLVATPVYEGGDGTAKNTITNVFHPVSFTPGIKKTLSGETANIPGETYAFNLKQGNTILQTKEIVYTPGAEFDGIVTFDPVNAYAAGDYAYTIEEVNNGTPGLLYGGAVTYVATVALNNETNRFYTSAETYSGGNLDEATDLNNVITNTFRSVDYQPFVWKSLIGNTAEIDNVPSETYNFRLTQKGPEGETYTDTASVVMTEGGVSRVEFDAINYAHTGVYTYLIEEVVPDDADKKTGIEYSAQDILLTVTVSKAEGTNALYVQAVYTGGDLYNAAEQEAAQQYNVITNKYSEISFAPEIKKILRGNVSPSENFTFTLYEEGEEIQSKTLAYDENAEYFVGIVEFDEIVVHEKGTYTFTIEETPNSTPGMAYSEAIVTYAVVVDRDEATGALEIVSETYEGGDVDAGAESGVAQAGNCFINTYSRIVYRPEIRKLVTGEPNVPEEIFTFTLTDGLLPPDCYTDTAEYLFDPTEFGGNNENGDGEENGAGDEAAEKPSTAKFKEISYYKPGTYTYYITENVPEKKTRGMNYSDAQIVLTVVVEQDEYGELSLTAGYTEDGTFTNIYKPSEVYDFKVSFTKKWEGKPGAGINWILYDSDGNVVHKKFNKYVRNDHEWYYEAWFNSDKGYYLIEDVPIGYIPVYENTGVHVNEVDRCYNGGTIINHQIPQTGEHSDMAFWLACLSISMSGLTVCAVRRIRNRRAH